MKNKRTVYVLSYQDEMSGSGQAFHVTTSLAAAQKERVRIGREDEADNGSYWRIVKVRVPIDSD